MKKFVFILLLAIAYNTNAQTYIYNFSGGYDGWSGDFSDYPVIDSIFYQLEFQRTNMPPPLDTTQFGLKMRGSNHSDDLFMFIKKKISGLLPNTSYKVIIDVDFASNAPKNTPGIGGSPGNGVTMKAGVTKIEPVKVNSSGFYQMNIDKSNQIQPGTDMDTIGHIGVSDTTTVFTIINRNNSAHQFSIRTDTAGEVWICIGTDSGFEGITTLYYKQIKVVFSSETSANEESYKQDFLIYPNPCSYSLNIRSGNLYTERIYNVYDQFGRVVLNGLIANDCKQINTAYLTNGVYYLEIEGADEHSFKFIKE